MMRRAQYEAVIRTVGIPARVTQAAPPKASVDVPFVGVARMGGENILINDFGVGSRILTFMQSSLPFVPVKFDQVAIRDEVLVLDFVQPVHEPFTGDVIGYRGIVRGK